MSGAASAVAANARTTGHLDTDAVARYRREGYLAPLRVLAAEDAAKRLAWLVEVEARGSGRLPPSYNVKAHLLYPWLWDLVHDPRILDPVESVLGPDILCWAASFFDKRPGEPHQVPWHQDATYWGLSAPEAVTAWVAFTPSRRENGCMRVSPGTHGTPLAHTDTRDPSNMLLGRETALVDIDEADAVDIELDAGEMSLHHILLVHGSPRNQSALRRCGFAIRYIPARLTSARARGTATLVRGRDHGHFDLEEAPTGNADRETRDRYSAVLRRWMRGVFGEIAREGGRSGEA